ncbi:MAG: zinc-ribbon domain-containing protein [Ruminococcus sp.]|nr:zinc-ribbon domain-containing protein [Ruminococcus sp.]
MSTVIKGKNDLLTWCLNHGERGKQLMSEWTGLSETGKQLNIDEVSYGSSSVKYTWKCSKGHLWNDTIQDRTYRYNSNCKVCSSKGTSYPEQFLYWAFKQIYPKTENRCRVLKTRDNPRGIEFDIGIPDIPLCIEYSPTFWHNGKDEIDNRKRQVCEERNIRFIEIIDDTYDEYESIFTRDYIRLKIKYGKQDEQLEEILKYILETLGHSIKEIDLNEVKKNAILYSNGHIAYEKSLEYNYPDLAKEYHKLLNEIKVSEIKASSYKKVYWQCNNCGYGKNSEWKVDVASRTSGKSGCPCCGYNWYDNKVHKIISSIVIQGINDLASQFPELAKEYHKSLNKFKASEIKARSNKKVYWQCTKCGYGKNGEWQVAPGVRNSNGKETGCPCCGYSWHDKKIHKGSSIVMQGTNDLASQFPELAKEYHKSLNEFKANEIKAHSGKKVYWQCTKCGYGKNGEWQATPGRRNQKGYETGCPKCKYKWYKLGYT